MNAIIKAYRKGKRVKVIIKDCYYYKACEYAKDDYFMFGNRRTQQEVEREAERLRKQALRGIKILPHPGEMPGRGSLGDEKVCVTRN